MSDKVVTRPATPGDIHAISELHARVFGPGRFARSAYRVREGQRDGDSVSAFCRVAIRGNRIIASVTFTEICVGGVPGALLLGPLAVDLEFAGQGFGRQLVAEGLEAAKEAGRTLVLLVGDAPYYGRFGFQVVPPGQITLPGPVNPARLLAASLVDGALARSHGRVSAIA